MRLTIKSVYNITVFSDMVKEMNFTCFKGKNCTISCPWGWSNFFEVFNICRRDLPRELGTDIVLNRIVQTRPASCSLAIEDSYNSCDFVQVPNLQKTAVKRKHRKVMSKGKERNKNGKIKPYTDIRVEEIPLSIHYWVIE